MKIVHKMSSNKKRQVMARKLSVLEVIEEEKDILLAQFSTSITHADKVKGWEAVLQRAKTVGLVAQNRDWRFIRDKVFSVWKSRTMTKRENAIAAGTAGSIKFDKVDLKILDIIGQDSPIIDNNIEDEVPVTEDQNQAQINQVVHFADVQNIPQSNTNIELSEVGNEIVPKKKMEGDTDDYLSQKKKLTLNLLRHDIYLRKLQALKLEKQLGVKRSKYTQELEVTREIKTENMCDMEFEY